MKTLTTIVVILIIIITFYFASDAKADPKWKPNAYGQGVGKAMGGRAVRHDPQQRLKKDAYGMGMSKDQFGRPVKTDLWGAPVNNGYK